MRKYNYDIIIEYTIILIIKIKNLFQILGTRGINKCNYKLAFSEHLDLKNNLNKQIKIQPIIKTVRIS